jgi:hypothetical protein
MVYPPDPAPPLQDGHERHQYLFVVDDETWSKWNDDEKVLALIECFGDYGFLLKQKVLESEKWHGWHVWVDYINE